MNACTRVTALEGAEIAVRKAQMTLADLEHDESSLVLKVPADGSFYHGYWGGAGKSWANADLRLLLPGEKVAGRSVVGTVAAAGKLAVTGEVPDEKWKEFGVGARLKVVVGGVDLEGVITDLVPEARPNGNAIVFRATLAEVPPWMVAGMRAKVEAVGK